MSDMPKRLLFIAYYYPPAGGSALPGSQRAVKFLRYMSRIDCHVLSLRESNYREYIDLNFSVPLPIRSERIYRTGSFDLFLFLLKVRSFFKRSLGKNHQQPQDASVSNSSGQNSIQAVSLKRSFFQRTKDFIYNFVYFPDDAAPWLIPAIFHGKKIIKTQKIDAIFATGMPWTSLIVGYVLHKVTGKPLIVDFRDPWVGNPFHVSRGRTFDGLMRILEKKIVTSAAVVSANTAPLRDDFLKRYPPLAKEKVVTLPNGFDPVDFEFLGDIDHDPNRLVLAHAGSLYGRRDPSPLLEALRRLVKNEPEVMGWCHFSQMGYVEPEYSFVNRHDDLLSAGVIDEIGQVPFQECLKKIASSDVAVIIQPGTKIQIPSKLYDYIAMQKRILAITPLDSALADIMAAHDLGHVFSPDDINGISNKIFELYKEKKRSLEIKSKYNISSFDVRNISDVLERKILDLF